METDRNINLEMGSDEVWLFQSELKWLTDRNLVEQIGAGNRYRPRPGRTAACINVLGSHGYFEDIGE